MMIGSDFRTWSVRQRRGRYEFRVSLGVTDGDRRTVSYTVDAADPVSAEQIASARAAAAGIDLLPSRALLARRARESVTIEWKRAAFDALDYVCADCGQEAIWNGKVLRLQLDHVNGDNLDHHLDNLRWLCPNCHTQTSTWGRAGRAKADRRERAATLIRFLAAQGPGWVRLARPALATEMGWSITHTRAAVADLVAAGKVAVAPGRLRLLTVR